MKEKIRINKLLYQDGLRQLRLVGFMGMTVFCLEAVLMATGYYVTFRDTYLRRGIAPAEIAVTELNLYGVHWILPAAIFVLTPIMTLMLFGFLNRRNASDFFHAIPDTRGTLYFSYAAAILTWVAATVVVSTALSAAAFAIVPGYAVSWDQVPRDVFIILCGCVLMMGGILIARSLTGTRFSCFLVSVMILFLPRLFIEVFILVLEEMMSFVAWEYSYALFNLRYNVVSGSVFGLFLGLFGRSVNPLEMWSSGVYSLILGLLYLAAGYMVFLRRRSESAGQSAVSRRLQGFFRLTVALTVCLIPICLMVAAWADGGIRSWDSSDWFLIVVFYVIAVLVYFLYELMTTGKLRRFGRLCRGLLLLAVMNGLVAAVLVTAYRTVSANCPDAEDIRYFVIEGRTDSSEYSYYSNIMQSYFDSRLGRVRIEDREIIEITARALARTVQQETQKTVIYDASDGYSVSTLAGTPVESGYSQVRRTVAIRTGWQTIHRNVRYTGEEWARVTELLGGIEQYREAYTNLPEPGPNCLIRAESGWLDDEAVENVYRVMREEIKTVDFSDWYAAVTGTKSETYLDTLTLTELLPNGHSKTYTRLPILDSLPKTAECYFEQINQEEGLEQNKAVWEEIKSALSTGQQVNGEEAFFAELNLELYLIRKGGRVEENRNYWFSGYRTDRGWMISDQGDGEVSKDAVISLLDGVFNRKFSGGGKTWPRVMLRINGYVEIDWTGGKEAVEETEAAEMYQQYCIFLEDEVPKELEVLLGVIGKGEE